MFPDSRWYLYDSTSGTTILKHPFRPGMSVPCPHCGQPLLIEGYSAFCCGEQFKTSFGEISQRRPVSTHIRGAGCGWASLRPFVHGESA